MIYSKTCEYAIRALTYLATCQEHYIQTQQISEATNVPGPYIAKIFQLLVRKKILKSLRGPSGGFALSRDPSSIMLIEVIEAIDTSTLINEECVMGLDKCSSKNPCPLHFVWMEAKENLIKKIEQCSLLDLNEKIGHLGYRELRRSRLNTPPSI